MRILGNNKNGISPVIGVILLVALTVALVTLLTIIVLDAETNTSENSDITLNIEETDTGIKLDVIRNENVQDIRVLSPDNSKTNLSSNVGDNHNIQGVSGTYSIISVLEDGSEETIRTITVSDSDIMSGTGIVNVNPDIEGAIVEVYDENEKLIDSTKTDEDGEYTIQYHPDTKIIVNIDGFEHEDLNNPLYAGASRDITENNNLDFEFDKDKFDTANINDKTTYISQGVDNEEDNTIYNVGHLQAMDENLGKSYRLVRDIDASKTQRWNNQKGFNPIGENNNEFHGSFDGQEYVISELYIDRPNKDYVGLIGDLDEKSEINNINLYNVNIKGSEYVGGLVGQNTDGFISKSEVVGSEITGDDDVGGIIGNNQHNVSEVYSSVNINSGGDAGGLVGINSGGNISTSYTNSNIIKGEQRIGGFVGVNFNGKISNSYAHGSVDIEGDSVGGLIGDNSGEVKHSYWDIKSTGQDSSEGGDGLDTNEMKGETYNDNFETNIINNSSFVGLTDDYPILKWQD